MQELHVTLKLRVPFNVRIGEEGRVLKSRVRQYIQCWMREGDCCRNGNKVRDKHIDDNSLLEDNARVLTSGESKVRWGQGREAVLIMYGGYLIACARLTESCSLESCAEQKGKRRIGFAVSARSEVKGD